MIITTLDALRVIKKNPNAAFTFPIYDVLSGNTKTAPKIPTLAAGSETIWLMDKGVEVPKSHYDLVHFLRDLWDDVAEIKKNGKVIAQRVAYGKPMLALDETVLLQSFNTEYKSPILILCNRTGNRLHYENLRNIMKLYKLKEIK